MTRDEIIRMAREAGIVAIHAEGATNWAEEVDALERFAALVATAEREQCALAAWEIVQYEVHADLADQVAQAIRARSQA